MKLHARLFQFWRAILVGISATICISLPEAQAFDFAPFWNQVFEYTGYTGGGGNGALNIVSSGVGGNGPTNPYSINPQASALTADAAAGATTITVANGATMSGGWDLLIIQMKGPQAGTYEFVNSASVAGNVITLSSALKNSYTAANKAQAIRVMHYTNVTLNSGSYLTTSAWNGSTGGVLVFRATGTVDINDGGGGLPATISMGQDSSANLAGGFAGGVSGHGESAFNLSNGAGGTADGSSDGKSLSPASPTYVIAGSGGNGNLNGGRGGGIIIIKAATINLGGRIVASGANYTSSGQGGAGGPIYVSANVLQKGSYSACGSFISNAGNTSSGTPATPGPIFVYYQTTLGTGCENRGTPASTTTYRLFSVH